MSVNSIYKQDRPQHYDHLPNAEALPFLSEPPRPAEAGLHQMETSAELWPPWIPQRLDWTEIWRIWRPSEHLLNLFAVRPLPSGSKLNVCDQRLFPIMHLVEILNSDR